MILRTSPAARHRLPISPFTLLVIVGTLLFRFLSLTSIENDHFVHLARAHQMRLGAWPIRDFVDPGQPLAYATSWLVAAVFGPSLLTEVVWCCAALALAAGLTCALARRVTGSVAIGLAAATLQVMAAPRLYNYPKLLVYVVALALAYAWATRPAARRLVALGAWTAVAFLFRHDHGVFVGLSCGVLLLAHTAGKPPGTTVRALALYGGAIVLTLLPWAVYVQASTGLAEYLRSAINFSRVEARRAAPEWPRVKVGSAGPLFDAEAIGSDGRVRIHVRWAEGVADSARTSLERRYRLTEPEFKDARTRRYILGDAGRGNVRALLLDPAVRDTSLVRRDVALGPERFALASLANLEAVAFYLMLALPLFVVGMLAVDRRTGHIDPVPAAWVACAAAMALLVSAGFLRDVLEVRLPDVYGPWPMLLAWLLGRAMPVRTPGGRPARVLVSVVAMTSLVLMAAIAALVGNVLHRVYQTHLFRDPGIVMHARERLDTLGTWPWRNVHPTPADLPLALYVHACTAPDDRVLAAWFAPELPVFARRGFAGGQPMWVMGYYETAADQARIAAQLARERIGLVLIPDEQEPAFAGHWPQVDAALRARLARAGTFSIGGRDVVILAPPRAPRRADGLPCPAAR